MNQIAPFIPEDIPQVASLLWRFLYGRHGRPPASFPSYLEELFFRSPWANPRFPSLTYKAEPNEICGFLGVIWRPMLYEQRFVDATFGSSFLVHPKSRATPAALELVRAYFSFGQDLSLSDTANQTSRAIWKAFSGREVRGSSKHWSRPLRSGSYALHAISRVAKRKWFSGPLRHVPTCLSRFSEVLPRGRFDRAFPAAAGVHASQLDVDTLVTYLSKSAEGFALRPEHTREPLNGLLAFMARMKAYGDLRSIALRDERENTIGCYVYYINEDRIGELAYLGAQDGARKKVLASLLHDAATHGAIAVHGKVEGGIRRYLSGQLHFPYDGHDPLLVHSHHPELINAIENGGMFLTRMDGEWCLKFGLQSTRPFMPDPQYADATSVCEKPASDTTGTSKSTIKVPAH